MTKIGSKFFFKKKGIRVTILLLCVFFSSENTFPINHWNRSYLPIAYDNKDKTIIIMCKFIDFEFGPLGEHGHLEWLDVAFSYEGRDYRKLMRFESRDQTTTKRAVVCLKNKKLGTQINFYECSYPRNKIVWYDRSTMFIDCAVFSNIGCVGITWFVGREKKIKDIMVSGSWHVNGLYCNDEIVGEVYDLEKISVLKAVSSTDVEILKNNKVYVTAKPDEIVIKGINLGENINVYTTSGTCVKSIKSNKDITKIKLPANQIYFVSIGQTKYKVPM